MRQYKLLPFKFTRLMNKELLVSEVGDFLLVPNGTVKNIIEGKINPKSVTMFAVRNANEPIGDGP